MPAFRFPHSNNGKARDDACGADLRPVKSCCYFLYINQTTRLIWIIDIRPGNRVVGGTMGARSTTLPIASRAIRTTQPILFKKSCCGYEKASLHTLPARLRVGCGASPGTHSSMGYGRRSAVPRRRFRRTTATYLPPALPRMRCLPPYGFPRTSRAHCSRFPSTFESVSYCATSSVSPTKRSRRPSKRQSAQYEAGFTVAARCSGSC